MITPPDNISTEPMPCSSPQEFPLNTTVSTTGPFMNSNENVFEKLTNLEVYVYIKTISLRYLFFYLECYIKTFEILLLDQANLFLAI
jgi:hypothetical protein